MVAALFRKFCSGFARSIISWQSIPRATPFGLTARIFDAQRWTADAKKRAKFTASWQSE